MLNLAVTMRIRMFIAGVLLLTALPLGGASAFQTPDGPGITSPRPGQALQGNVSISVAIPAEGFRSAELDFAYHDDPTGTWFLIAAVDKLPQSGLLTTWDTTTITDGIYDLRLVVYRVGSDQQEVVIRGVRVRNYTPVEKDTPAPSLPAPAASLTPSPTPSATRQPYTSTPLPTNPAIVTQSMLTGSAARGVGAAAALFLLGALYVRLRGAGRRR
jgi:hypothetical protein